MLLYEAESDAASEAADVVDVCSWNVDVELSVWPVVSPVNLNGALGLDLTSSTSVLAEDSASWRFLELKRLLRRDVTGTYSDSSVFDDVTVVLVLTESPSARLLEPNLLLSLDVTGMYSSSSIGLEAVSTVLVVVSVAVGTAADEAVESASRVLEENLLLSLEVTVTGSSSSILDDSAVLVTDSVVVVVLEPNLLDLVVAGASASVLVSESVVAEAVSVARLLEPNLLNLEVTTTGSSSSILETSVVLVTDSVFLVDAASASRFLEPNLLSLEVMATGSSSSILDDSVVLEVVVQVVVEVVVEAVSASRFLEPNRLSLEVTATGSSSSILDDSADLVKDSVVVVVVLEPNLLDLGVAGVSASTLADPADVVSTLVVVSVVTDPSSVSLEAMRLFSLEPTDEDTSSVTFVDVSVVLVTAESPSRDLVLKRPISLDVFVSPSVDLESLSFVLEKRLLSRDTKFPDSDPSAVLDVALTNLPLVLAADETISGSSTFSGWRGLDTAGSADAFPVDHVAVALWIGSISIEDFLELAVVDSSRSVILPAGVDFLTVSSSSCDRSWIVLMDDVVYVVMTLLRRTTSASGTSWTTTKWLSTGFSWISMLCLRGMVVVVAVVDVVVVVVSSVDLRVSSLAGEGNSWGEGDQSFGFFRIPGRLTGEAGGVGTLLVDDCVT